MIYCFDLDGTLCGDTKGEYEKAEPIKSRIEQVNKLFDGGHTIIVETARGSITKKDWYDLTKTQLECWGLRYHTLRTGVKVYADFYIDDKSITDKNFFLKW